MDLYDYALLDTPPSLGLLTVNAMVAAEGSSCRCSASTSRCAGWPSSARPSARCGSTSTRAWTSWVSLPTMYDGRTVHGREAVQLLEESFGGRVYRTRIGKAIRFAEAPVEGKSVICATTPRARRPRWYRHLSRGGLGGPDGRGGRAQGRGMRDRR